MSDNSSVHNNLCMEQQLCDAVIRVADTQFQVHKVILSNCSSYFRALFTHWSPPDRRVFHIPNVSPDIIRLIIEFAYTGFVPVTKANIQELFIVADRFCVKDIVQACRDFLEKQLAPDNCIGIWRFADIYYSPKLKDKTYLFLVNHFEEVSATSEEFLLLTAQELAKLIENDELNVTKEERVFEAILRWFSKDPEERRTYISPLLSKVRLALMSPQYLLDNINHNALANKECRPILLRTMAAMLDAQTQSLSDSALCNRLLRPRLPNAILLAVGGWSAGKPIGSIDAFDVNANCWVSIDEYVPRAYLGTAFLDGSLYCLGGCDRRGQLNTVHKFDLDKQTWQEVAPMHFRRCYVSVTVMDGYIYAMGGFDGHNRLATAERYQASTNQWTLISPMNEPRSDASCASLHGKVYICGGFNGSLCLSTAECYDPETNQWTMINPMANRRSGIGVIAYAGQIFAVGGFTGINRLCSVEIYSPQTHSWNPAPSMLNPRSNFGITVINDRLFVVGGFNSSNPIYEVECFDLKTGEWSDVSYLNICRSALSCCVVYGLPNMADYAAPRDPPQFSDEERVDCSI